MIQTECTKMSIQVWSATINQVSQFIYTASNSRQIGKNTKPSRQSSHDEENYVKSLVKSINSSRLPHWLLRPLSSNFYILYKQEKRRKSIKQWKVSRSNNNVRYPQKSNNNAKPFTKQNNRNEEMKTITLWMKQKPTNEELSTTFRGAKYIFLFLRHIFAVRKFEMAKSRRQRVLNDIIKQGLSSFSGKFLSLEWVAPRVMFVKW